MYYPTHGNVQHSKTVLKHDKTWEKTQNDKIKAVTKNKFRFKLKKKLFIGTKKFMETFLF